MAWVRIEGDDLDRLRKRFERSPRFAVREAAILRTPFYRRGELVQMHDGAGPAFVVAVGTGAAREYYPLNGANADIQAANKAASLVLTRENVIPYLRFFTMFLRDPAKDNFDLVESLNGCRLVGPDGSEQRQPDDMRLVCADENPQGGTFTCRGFMAHRGRLSGFSIIVSKSGEVEMTDDVFLGFIVRLNA